MRSSTNLGAYWQIRGHFKLFFVPYVPVHLYIICFRADLTVVCKGMEFALYPFDKHVCHLKLTSCKYRSELCNANLQYCTVDKRFSQNMATLAEGCISRTYIVVYSYRGTFYPISSFHLHLPAQMRPRNRSFRDD